MKALSVAAAGLVVAFAMHGCLTGPVKEEKGRATFDRPPDVRVGISGAQNVSAIEISASGAVRIESEGASQELEEFGTQTIRREGGSFMIGSVAGTAGLMEFSGAALKLYGFGGSLAFGGRAYRGSFEILARDGGLSLVNVVDVEDYLAGVVGKEMNLSDPEEALKAQIVAARTYGLYEIEHSTLKEHGLPFDVFDDERSQVYGGLERENETSRRLVEETRGMVVRYQGNLIKAFYSSTCGGATDPCWEVLDGTIEQIPPLAGATCGFCEGAPLYRWTMKAKPLTEVSSALGARIENGRVVDVAIDRTLPSGRAATVKVTVEVGRATKLFTLKANEEFRRPISAREIKSTLWNELAVRGGKLYLSGRGWGHGGGLCQEGAREMGRRGSPFAEILTHYYPQAQVEKIY